MNNKTLLTILLSLSAGTFAACGGEAEIEITGDIAVGEVCTATQECVPGSMCFNEFCVGAGNLRTSLSFYQDTDLDLYLRTPSGEVISFLNTYADGGELDVDQCIGSCDDAPVHVENIVFDGAPPRGSYLLWVENYDGREPADFNIEVAGNGISMDFASSVGGEAGDLSERMAFEF